jgi:hypothetical protein
VLLSWAIGVVRERPVWARLLGVTASCSAEEEGVRASWLAFDLTDAGGEVFAWASGSGDMGSLIRPSVRHRVAVSMANIAGWALRTLARMWSLGAAETQRKANRGGSRLAYEDVRRGGGWRIGAAADVRLPGC